MEAVATPSVFDGGACPAVSTAGLGFAGETVAAVGALLTCTTGKVAAVPVCGLKRDAMRSIPSATPTMMNTPAALWRFRSFGWKDIGPQMAADTSAVNAANPNTRSATHSPAWNAEPQCMFSSASPRGFAARLAAFAADGRATSSNTIIDVPEARLWPSP